MITDSMASMMPSDKAWAPVVVFTSPIRYGVAAPEIQSATMSGLLESPLAIAL